MAREEHGMKWISHELLMKEQAAERWRLLSVFCLIIYGKTLSPIEVPRERTDRFVRIGQELEILEHDLTECINEFTMAFRVYYSELQDLELKKFAVVYHADNFFVRVHKLVENTYGLLSLMVGLDPARRRRRNEPSLRDDLRGKMRDPRLIQQNLGPILVAVTVFENSSAIRRSSKARNLFVHLFREEPKWPMLSPERRFQEPEDPLARDIRAIEQAPQLDEYANEKRQEFVETLEAIRRFRDELFDQLHTTFQKLQ